jgi:hypothetical protein
MEETGTVPDQTSNGEDIPSVGIVFRESYDDEHAGTIPLGGKPVGSWNKRVS